MSKKITLTAIMRKNRCSVSSLLLVLRGRPGIASDTREPGRVQAARSLHFHPRPDYKDEAPMRQVGHLRNVGVILKPEHGMGPSSQCLPFTRVGRH